MQFESHKVVLAPLDDEGIYSNKFPQTVKIAPTQSYQMVISSINRDLNDDGTLKGSAFSFELSKCFQNVRATRLTPVSIHAALSIPNINIRNRHVTFTVQGGLTYDIDIPEGYYTRDGFLTILVQMMTTAVGGGTVFTYVEDLNLKNATITINAGAFRFDDCTMISKGTYLCEFLHHNVYAASKIVIGLRMFYTPDIYVVATRLVTASRETPKIGQTGQPYFCAFPLTNGYVTEHLAGQADGFMATQLILNRGMPLSSVGITLVDSFGEEIYRYCPLVISDFFEVTIQISD